METTKKTTFIKGAAILTVAGLICKVIGLLIRVYALKIIKMEGMFYYELVFPTYSWLLIISSSGIPTAISRMVAERMGVGNYDGAKRVFRRSLLLLLIIGVATTAIMFFGAPFFGMHLLHGGEGAILALRALAPALVFVSVICAFRGYLQGLQRMTGTSVSQLAEQVFKFVFGLLLAKLLMDKYAGLPIQYAAGAAGLLLGVTISEALALIAILIFFARTKGKFTALIVDPDPNEKVLGPMLAIAIPITLGASILPLANMLDTWMIKPLLGRAGLSEQAAQLNFTALCTHVRSIINLPATLTVGVAMSVVPAISTARVRKDREGVKNLSLLSLKIAMAVGIPCAVGLCVLARPIISMLYPNPPEAVDVAAPLMRVAAFTVIFISLVQSATGALQGVGRQRLPMWFLLIGGATKVVVNLVFIPMKDVNILGAVFSNLACFGIAGILDMIALLKVTHAKLNVLDTFLKPAFASALMGAAAWAVQELLNRIPLFQTGWMSRAATIVAILIAVAVYAAFTMLFGMFTKEELTYIPGGRKLARFARR